MFIYIYIHRYIHIHVHGRGVSTSTIGMYMHAWKDTNVFGDFTQRPFVINKINLTVMHFFCSSCNQPNQIDSDAIHACWTNP